MYYGHMFYFDQPVRRIWYTHGDLPAAAHWEKVIKAVFDKPVSIPNELYRIFRGPHRFEPSVMVSTQHGFATQEEAEQWVDGMIMGEIRQLSNQGYGGEVIRETIINVDHIVRTIRRHRSAVTVNAGLYYDHAETAIEDWQWDEMAYRLVDLQKRYYFILPFVDFFDSHFNDFDASTGFDLPYRNEPFYTHIVRAIEYLEKHRKL